MAPHILASEATYSELQKSQILRQLERMLDNPHFAHSKRFPSFLRFIVQEELEDRGDQLKERTLGIEVFGRDAGYDTNSDPIVRVTAAEIRKRIAQYYQEAGTPDDVRISLPPGSYVPHFEWRDDGSAVHTMQPATDHSVGTRANDPLSTALPRTHRASWILLCIGFATLLLAGGLYWIHARPTTLDRFWAPVLAEGDPVVVCFPQSHFNGINLRDSADPTQVRHMDEPMSGVIVDDLQPLVSVSGLLEMKNQRYVLMGEDSTTLTDLRQGATIFVGAFDNAWTLRMTRGLRYRFGNDPEMAHFWIEDTQSPAHQIWSIDRSVQEKTNNYRDYAIVARFHDATTGKIAVIAAGIARGGTVAAGEFLTQPGNMDAILARAPRNWAGQNMEFVLSTEIIDGRSAAPKVEATYFW